MDDIREFFLDKIKEKHIVDKILKEYEEDKRITKKKKEQNEIDSLLTRYYLTEMNYQEYKKEEQEIQQQHMLNCMD